MNDFKLHAGLLPVLLLGRRTPRPARQAAPAKAPQVKARVPGCPACNGLGGTMKRGPGMAIWVPCPACDEE